MRSEAEVREKLQTLKDLNYDHHEIAKILLEWILEEGSSVDQHFLFDLFEKQLETIMEQLENDERKFYERNNCRICKAKVKDCACHPIPCPFCKEEFGFTQDWNIHIQNNHKNKLKKKEVITKE